LLSLMITTSTLYSQKSASDADRATYQNSCRTIAMTLRMREIHREPDDPPPAADDPFTAGAKACAQLKAALSAGDSGTIGAVEKELRPILAILGSPPTSAKEQFEAMEKKAAGLRGEDLFDELPDLAKRAFNAGENGQGRTTL